MVKQVSIRSDWGSNCKDVSVGHWVSSTREKIEKLKTYILHFLQLFVREVPSYQNI